MSRYSAGWDFPEEFVRHGDVTLPNGVRSNIYYDVNAMLEVEEWLKKLVDTVPLAEHYVGIEVGGERLAKAVAETRGKPYSSFRGSELRGPVPEESCLLIDDVVSTVNSFVVGVEVLGMNGVEERNIRYYSVLDKRPTDIRHFCVSSAFDVGKPEKVRG